MGRVFVLFRHGPVCNPKDLVYGTLPGFPLEKGSGVLVRKSASALESTLGRRPAGIVASPLLRSVQTAAQLAECFDCATYFDTRLAEVESVYQGSRRSEVLPLVRRGLSGDRESPEEVSARMEVAVSEWLERKDGVIVFVSHLLPIRLAVAGFGCQAADLSPCGYHVLAEAGVGTSTYRLVLSR